VRKGEVAAGRHGVHQAGHDRVRVVGVRDRVQERDERDRDGHGEVQQLRGPGEDDAGVAQVGVDVLGGARLAAGQQGAGVGEDDRVGLSTCTTLAPARAGQTRLDDRAGGSSSLCP